MAWASGLTSQPVTVMPSPALYIENICHIQEGTETVSITPLRTLVSSPSSEWASCREQGHAGSKTLLQQNPLVLNWGYRLMQVVLYTAV